MGHAQVHAYTADTRPLLPAPMRKVIYAQATCKKTCAQRKNILNVAEKCQHVYVEKIKKSSRAGGFHKKSLPKGIVIAKIK